MGKEVKIVRCRLCGESDMLYPDPAGYFEDAFIPQGHPQAGAPLLCRWCRDANHPTIIAARLKKADCSQNFPPQI